MTSEMREKVASGQGFIAALDQSGGSTPKALAAYGVPESAYGTDEEMFDLVHEMRTRIITDPAFTGERVLGAILFEGTMDRDIAGRPSARYLWETKHVVPFLKIDKGLEEEADGVQLMKPIPQLSELLARAKANDVFGTKERSVIRLADPDGIAGVVSQQFELGEHVLDAGLVPILEPEVDIRSPEKEAAEELLLARIMEHLDGIGAGRQVMLKLSLPSEDGIYADLIAHPQVLRVVALSGGYSREEANERLARNPGLIASFSRALIGELSSDQDDAEFSRTLDRAIESIYQASLA